MNVARKPPRNRRILRRRHSAFRSPRVTGVASCADERFDSGPESANRPPRRQALPVGKHWTVNSAPGRARHRRTGGITGRQASRADAKAPAKAMISGAYTMPPAGGGGSRAVRAVLRMSGLLDAASNGSRRRQLGSPPRCRGTWTWASSAREGRPPLPRFPRPWRANSAMDDDVPKAKKTGAGIDDRARAISQRERVQVRARSDAEIGDDERVRDRQSIVQSAPGARSLQDAQVELRY